MNNNAFQTCTILPKIHVSPNILVQIKSDIRMPESVSALTIHFLFQVDFPALALAQYKVDLFDYLVPFEYAAFSMNSSPVEKSVRVDIIQALTPHKSWIQKHAKDTGGQTNRDTEREKEGKGERTWLQNIAKPGIIKSVNM